MTANQPDRLRGPNYDGAWCDELAAWPDAEDVWLNLQMALRVPGPLGDRPCAVVSTTPRPLRIVRQIHDDPTTVVTRLRTDDNAANLDAATLAFLHSRHDGTTLGRQELEGELLDNLEGALWTRAMIDKHRVAPHRSPEGLPRIVVAIDPSGSSGANSDEVGIIVAGSDRKGDAAHYYVLEDISGRYTPRQWAEAALGAFDRWKADRIVAETNFGGQMVEYTLRALRPGVPFFAVTATRGKVVRAEPIVAMYEQGRVHHVGPLPGLEDQLCTWSPGMRSPDRLDALVWAVTDLSTRYEPGPSRWVRLDWMGR